MADRLPIGEFRFVHFTEPGTTRQPGEWTGPTHVMVVEHRRDETALIIRPFLDADEDDPVNEPGDLLENLGEVPSQKIDRRGGKHYLEKLVFDVCPTWMLPVSLAVREPAIAAAFDFATRTGYSMSMPVLREYCPAKWRCEERNTGFPSPPRSGTGSGGGAVGLAQQLSSVVQVLETLTIAQTKSLYE